MSASYLDAREIAEIAHEAVFRAWFRLGGATDPMEWGQLTDAAKRDARDSVSARMRTTYKNERIPTAIPTEYAEFWKALVDAAIRLEYVDGDA